MSDLDDEELEATRRLNGVAKKSNIEKDIMSEEAFNELIDNFEVVETLTEYGRKAIKQNVKKLQTRIKELEEALLKVKDKNTTLFITCRNSIPKQKIKDKIEELKNAKRETTRENWHYIYTIQLKILEELLEGE